MGEARVCIRCGTPARAERFSCNECGGAVVYAATPDPVPAPAYAPATVAAASPRTDPAPPPPPSDYARSDANWAPSPANWAPSTASQSTASQSGEAPAADWAPPAPSQQSPAGPIDGSAFVPGEAHIAPELHRRARNAVLTANVLIVLVVVGLVGFGVVGWSVFGSGGGGGGPSELRPYLNGSGGQVYSTSKFTVRLPSDYKMVRLTQQIGGYEVPVNMASAASEGSVVAVANGTMPSGAAAYATDHLARVGELFAASVKRGSTVVTVKSVTWHGRPAYDVKLRSEGAEGIVRLAIDGRRFLAFVVIEHSGPGRVMDTLLDSYTLR